MSYTVLEIIKKNITIHFERKTRVGTTQLPPPSIHTYVTQCILLYAKRASITCVARIMNIVVPFRQQVLISVHFCIPRVPFPHPAHARKLRKQSPMPAAAHYAMKSAWVITSYFLYSRRVRPCKLQRNPLPPLATSCVGIWFFLGIFCGGNIIYVCACVYIYIHVRIKRYR